jgi:hypothetical protein
MARIIAHLAEVDVRRVHAKKGFPSLFSYCVEVLHFSEDEACRRIEAARLARRFPCIEELLDSGAVTLTVVGLLKPHRTNANQEELLAGVSGVSVRLAKEWLAARFPRPDVPSSIRKCPEINRAESAPLLESPLRAEPPASAVSSFTVLSAPTRIIPGAAGAARNEPPMASMGSVASTAPMARPTLLGPNVSPAWQKMLPAPPLSCARVDPLARDRFLVRLTVGRQVKEKLDLARDLMRHRNPEGDMSVTIERALDALIAELTKKKFGQTDHPQETPRPSQRTRVTSRVRREVVERDGICCSFVAADGRRCETRAFLEFDHQEPKGRGGSSEGTNVRLLCRAHNGLAAEGTYGVEHIRQAIADARATPDARDVRMPPCPTPRVDRPGMASNLTASPSVRGRLARTISAHPAGNSA